MDEQSGGLNLIKLCVGCDSVEQLRQWQSERIRSGAFANPEHVTRMRPRREAELLEGGSLYWVIKGFVLARQRIIDLERRESPDGITRCAIIFDREIVRTVASPEASFSRMEISSVARRPARSVLAGLHRTRTAAEAGGGPERSRSNLEHAYRG